MAPSDLACLVPPLYPDGLHATARAIGPTAALHDLSTNTTVPQPRQTTARILPAPAPRLPAFGRS